MPASPPGCALLRRACRVGGIRDRLDDRQLAAWHRRFVKKLSALLARPPTHAEGAKLQRAIAKHRRNLFLFLTNRALDATNNVVHTDGPQVVLYGVNDLVVVARDGLTVVTTVDKSADLKRLVESLPPALKDRA